MPRNSVWLALLTLLAFAPALRADELPGAGAAAAQDDPFLAASESYDPAEDARALRRNRMLKWHQGLALSSLGLLTAQNAVGQMLYSGYKLNDDFTARHPSLNANLGTYQNLHRALGYSTFGLYTLAASMAILAPEGNSDEEAESGSVGVHKALAWVHGSGMMLMPWFGLVTAKTKGKLSQDTVNTMRTAHLAAGYVTWAALGGAMLVIVID